MSTHFFEGGRYNTAESLVKVYTLKALTTFSDPETGRDGSVAGGPVTAGQIETITALLGQLNFLEQAVERAKDAPELRRKFQTMADSLARQIAADAWGPSIVQISRAVPDQVIQTAAARSLSAALFQKTAVDLAPRLGIASRAQAEAEYAKIGGAEHVAGLAGMLAVKMLYLQNEGAPADLRAPGWKSWCETHYAFFETKANGATNRARVAEVADTLAGLMVDLRALKAMASR
jgi:hypothetical protein